MCEHAHKEKPVRQSNGVTGTGDPTDRKTTQDETEPYRPFIPQQQHTLRALVALKLDPVDALRNTPIT